MKLVFTGIQWCWKGTQARVLVEKYWYTLVEMWAEFRKIVKSWTELGNKVKEIIESWAQVDSELGWEIMREAIKSQTSDKIIFDGFIRNDWNKLIFDESISWYFINSVPFKSIRYKASIRFKLNNNEVIIPFIKFDFPEPVDPTTAKCVIRFKSI